MFQAVQDGSDITTREVSLPGGPALISGYSADPYFEEVEARAHEMFALANLAWQRAGSGMILDIGGNIGLSCIALARACPSNRIAVFEPSPRSARLIRRNLAANGIKHVEVFEAAVSDVPGRIQLNMTLNSGSSHVLKHSHMRASGEPVEVDVVVPDRVIQERISFVKLDVEGHEPNAIAGMAGLIQDGSPLIYMEFNPWCLNAFGGHSPAAFACALWDRFEVSSVGIDGSLQPLPGDAIDFVYQALVQQAHADVVLKLRPGALVPSLEQLTLPAHVADELARGRAAQARAAASPRLVAVSA